MHQGRFESKLSLGGGVHILGERNFDDEEEELKEIDELRMIQELTSSINDIQGGIERNVNEQEEGFEQIDNSVE